MPTNILAIMTRLACERDWVVSRRNNFAVAEHANASEEHNHKRDDGLLATTRRAFSTVVCQGPTGGSHGFGGTGLLFAQAKVAT
jgi:hypothetical protein